MLKALLEVKHFAEYAVLYLLTSCFWSNSMFLFQVDKFCRVPQVFCKKQKRLEVSGLQTDVVTIDRIISEHSEDIYTYRKFERHAETF